MLNMSPFRRRALARKPSTEKLREQCKTLSTLCSVLQGRLADGHNFPNRSGKATTLGRLKQNDFRQVSAGRTRDERSARLTTWPML